MGDAMKKTGAFAAFVLALLMFAGIAGAFVQLNVLYGLDDQAPVPTPPPQMLRTQTLKIIIQPPVCTMPPCPATSTITYSCPMEVYSSTKNIPPNPPPTTEQFKPSEYPQCRGLLMVNIYAENQQFPDDNDEINVMPIALTEAPNTPPTVDYIAQPQYTPPAPSIPISVIASDTESDPRNLVLNVPIVENGVPLGQLMICTYDQLLGRGVCAPNSPKIQFMSASYNANRATYKIMINCPDCTRDITINGLARDDGTPPLVSTPNSWIIKSAQTRPLPPSSISYTPEEPKSSDWISLIATQPEPWANGMRHKYTIYDDKGVVLFGPEDWPVDQNSLQSEFLFECTSQKCKTNLFAEVITMVGGIASDPYRLEIPLDLPNPSKPKCTTTVEGKKVTATCAQEKDDAQYHSYEWYCADAQNKPVPLGALQKKEISGGITESSAEYGGLCANNFIAFNYWAINNEGGIDYKSDISSARVDLLALSIGAPIAIAASPDDTGERLKSLSSKTGDTVVLGLEEALTVTMNGSPKEPAENNFDSYEYAYSSQGGEWLKFGGSANTYTIDCASLPDGNKCKAGQDMRVSAVGIKGGSVSNERYMYFAAQQEKSEDIIADGICGAQIDWLKYMTIGMAALIAVIGIAYMLGNATANPRLLDWAKNEIVQVIMSVLMFFLILWLMDVMCMFDIAEPVKWAGMSSNQLINSVPEVNLPKYTCLFNQTVDGCKPANRSMMRVAQASAQWGIKQAHLLVVLMRYDMGMLNVRASFNSYQPQTAGLGGNGFTYMPFSGDWTTIGTLNMLMNMNSTFMMGLMTQLFSLIFFASASGFFTMFVPLGFVLRSVPFMRPIGGAMVAIGVGLYVFMPTSLAIAGIVGQSLWDNDDVNMAVAGRFGSSTDPESIMQNVELREIALANVPSTTYLGLEDLKDKLSPVFSITPSGMEHSTPDLSVYFKLTAINFLRSVFFPTIALIITVVFIRDLGALMGEDVDASKLIQLV